ELERWDGSTWQTNRVVDLPVSAQGTRDIHVLDMALTGNVPIAAFAIQPVPSFPAELHVMVLDHSADADLGGPSSFNPDLNVRGVNLVVDDQGMPIVAFRTPAQSLDVERFSAGEWRPIGSPIPLSTNDPFALAWSPAIGQPAIATVTPTERAARVYE